MSNAIYKKDLHDVALAVAQGSKDYTDNSIEKLKWELGTYDLSAETINGTTMLLPTPANTIQATMVRIDGVSTKYNQIASITSGSGTDASSSNVLAFDLSPSGVSVIGHIYLCALKLSVSDNAILHDLRVRRPFIASETPISASKQSYYFIGTATEVTSLQMQIVKNTGATSETYSYDTANVIDLTAIFGSGNEPTDVATAKTSLLALGINVDANNPYSLGEIHNLELSGLKVEGANVLNPDNTFTYSSYTDLAYFECVGGATYTLKSFGSYTGSFGIFKYDGNSWSSIEAHTLNSGYTITAPTDAIRIGVNGVVSQSVMVVRGSTAPTTFVPYVTPTTLPIDLTTIEDSGGNKLFADGSIGSAGTICDELAPNKAIAKSREVVLNGTENWFISDTNNVENKGRYFYLPLPNCFNVSSGAETSEITATYFEAGSPNAIYGGSALAPYISYWTSAGRINLYDRNTIAFMTLAEFKQWLATRYANGNPIVVRYRMKTPIEADIDLSQFVKFEAYSNGSITLVNTNNQDTTSTFKYLKEVAK